MIPRLDRYVLRQLLFPFALAVVGFVLFILLNLIVQLSDFMIDRDVSWADLMRVLVYKMPDLVVLGLPVAVLFAVFLALGRLSHDRELVALQASGTSLRRLIVPILVFGVLVSGLTLGLNETLTPWANEQYQRLLRQLIVRGAVPQIRDNTFFKDDQNRFFYVRRYDRERKLLQDVLVYDPTGQTYLPDREADRPALLRSPYPQLITAKEATWDGTAWTLRDGVVHQLDENGALAYQARFERLTLVMGEAIEALFAAPRTPREMGLRELYGRIQTLRASGYAASELIVELQIKLVVPFEALVFALFAAPLSLSFGLRSRAAGIVASVVLTSAYQGTLFWTQTLARRELLDPYWGPWLPNLGFGLLGLALVLGVDRLSRLEWGRWLQRVAVLAALAAVTVPAHAAPLPLEVRAQALEVSRDGSTWLAQGEVSATYGAQRIEAQQLRLSRTSAQGWRLEATREVTFRGEGLVVRAEGLTVLLERAEGLRPRWLSLRRFVATGQSASFELAAEHGTLRFRQEGEAPSLAGALLEGAARVALGGTALRAESLALEQLPLDQWQIQARGQVILEEPQRLTRAAELVLEVARLTSTPELRRARAFDFQGAGQLRNAAGETHPVRFAGRRGTLTFQRERLTRLDLEGARLTTCDCAARLEAASYVLSARQVTLWPEEWILGRDLTFRALGVPLFWTPVFLAPLKDLQQNPLLPELGQDRERGWFARWRLPLFVDRGNTGALLVDYFSRFGETGLGLDWTYALPVQSQSGRLSVYHLVGRQEVLDLSWAHRWRVAPGLTLDGSLTRREVRPGTAGVSRWAYRFRAEGQGQGWRWGLGAAREEASQDPEAEEPPRYRVLERLPELSLSHAAALEGTPLRYGAGLSWGRYREQRRPQDPFVESQRLDASGQLGLAPLALGTPALSVGAGAEARLSLYGAGAYRLSYGGSLTAAWTPAERLSLRADYRYRAVEGRSPFAFDALSVADRLDLSASAERFGVASRLSTAYLPEQGRFEPLTLSLSTTWGEHALQLSLNTPPGRLAVERLRAQEVWSAPWGRLALDGGFQVSNRRFEDLIVRLSVGGLRLGARLDPNALALKRTNAELSLRLGPWSLDFGGELDWGQRRLTALQLGVVHHFCHDCWQVGLYLTQRRLWLQVQINAFPQAGVRYSPTDGALRFP